MSEKIKEIINYVNVHEIYCDKCGEFICKSEEYDDGYYEDTSEYEQSICIHKGNSSEWYRYFSQLCGKCKRDTTNELTKILENFGFEKE